MVREITFRSWHKRYKWLGFVTQIDFDDKEISTKRIKDGYIGQYDFSEVEIMQFTGLHDKKGKDIYEGDILFSKGSYYGSDMEYKVFWHEKETCFFLINKKYMERPIPLSVVNPDGCGEVIGNIYENPELLEDVV